MVLSKSTRMYATLVLNLLIFDSLQKISMWHFYLLISPCTIEQQFHCSAVFIFLRTGLRGNGLYAPQRISVADFTYVEMLFLFVHRRFMPIDQVISEMFNHYW